MDLRWLPAPIAVSTCAFLGVGLIVASLSTRARLVGAACCAAMALHAAHDAARCTSVTGALSFSTLLALVTAALTLVHVKCRQAGRWLGTSAGAAAMLLALPLAHIAGSARADYVRPADAIVVLGARVYADGRPSLALADRVWTACSLMKRGLAPRLIVSGGPGDGELDEPHVMRELALACGIPDAAIAIDGDGLNTRNTAVNVARMLRQPGQPSPRVLVVSHDYHLARARMAFDGEGVVALTVPAHETRTLRALPYYVAREVPGFWVYFLRRF